MTKVIKALAVECGLVGELIIEEHHDELEAFANAIKADQAENAKLREALLRMINMHNLMMKKVNHGASFYDAECLKEMNEAPIEALQAVADSEAILKDN